MRASVRKTAVNVCYRCDFGEHTGNNNNSTYKQKLVQEVETSLICIPQLAAMLSKLSN